MTVRRFEAAGTRRLDGGDRADGERGTARDAATATVPGSMHAPGEPAAPSSGTASARRRADAWFLVVLAIFAIPLVIAVISDAALSWDGAFYLFRTLDTGVPFIPHDRLIDAPIHWPVLWADALTDSLPVLRATFGVVHVVTPFVALACCWWVVRTDAPALIVWPLLGIGMATLPGQLNFISEGIKAYRSCGRCSWPYTRDARQWSKLRWTDVYSGETFATTTRSQGLDERTARVQSYSDVIARYRTHPESKSLGPDGSPCGQRTVGLLRRRPVVLGELVHIGKETNRLEEVEQGLVHDWNEVQLVFREPQDQVKASTGQSDTHRDVQRICRSCGSIHTAGRRSYCSPACRQRAYRHRRRLCNDLTQSPR